MKYCPRCKTEKSLSEFHRNKSRKDGHHSVCKICFRPYINQYLKVNRQKHRIRVALSTEKSRIKRQKQLWDYLEGKKCADCNIEDRRVLTFDHVRDIKILGISQMVSKRWKWEKILAEIEKCDIVCANCHLIRTMNQFNWNKLEWITEA